MTSLFTDFRYNEMDINSSLSVSVRKLYSLLRSRQDFKKTIHKGLNLIDFLQYLYIGAYFASYLIGITKKIF